MLREIIEKRLLILPGRLEVVIEGELAVLEAVDEAMEVVVHLGANQGLGKVDLDLINERLECPLGILTGDSLELGLGELLSELSAEYLIGLVQKLLNICAGFLSEHPPNSRRNRCDPKQP